MGTFTVSIEVETVNVPIIGLAQARASGRVSDPVQARMFLRAPEQDRNAAQDPGGSDPPAAPAPLPALRAATTLAMRTV